MKQTLFYIPENFTNQETTCLCNSFVFGNFKPDQVVDSEPVLCGHRVEIVDKQENHSFVESAINLIANVNPISNFVWTIMYDQTNPKAVIKA